MIKDTILLGEYVCFNAKGTVYCDVSYSSFATNPISRLQIFKTTNKNVELNEAFKDVYPYYGDSSVFTYSGFWRVLNSDSLVFKFNNFYLSKEILNGKVIYKNPVYEYLKSNKVITDEEMGKFRFLIKGLDDKWYPTPPFIVKYINEE